jgi:hypothetical protein
MSLEVTPLLYFLIFILQRTPLERHGLFTAKKLLALNRSGIRLFFLYLDYRRLMDFP